MVDMGEIGDEIDLPPELLERHNGPFGDFGYEIGEWALKFLAELQDKPVISGSSSAENRSFADRDAFEAFVELDTGLRFVEAAASTGGEEIGDLHRSFEDLHVALPFTEGERRWMLWDYKNWQGRGLVALKGQTVKIMDAGVTSVVSGDDVIRRWSAWRREQDEFAGQGGLELARRSLRDIASRVLTDDTWPDDYRHLRRG
jgi:hypothetical protein